VSGLFDQIHVNLVTGCWEWTGSLNEYGYGRWYAKGTSLRAHRQAFIALRGPIEDDLVIDHLCRVRHCINPWHMEPVTRGENVLRGDGITARNTRATHCPHGHAYSESNTYMHRGFRKCRECMRIKNRESWKKDPAAYNAKTRARRRAKKEGAAIEAARALDAATPQGEEG